MTRTATAVRIPTARRGSAGTSPSQGGAFRRDVAGLRAVAVVLVVLFDAGLGPAGGFVGVDVCFVLSGYLVTALLLREAEATGRIALAGFYARRIHRLLPAASMVLVTVLVLARIALPAGAGPIAGDAARAALFVAVPRGPFAHFWPIAITGQFYLIWPVVLLVLIALSGRLGAQTVPFVLGCAVGASLAWSLLHTDRSPATQAWELGAGALLALGGNDRHRIPFPLAAALSWLGLVLVLVSALLYRPGGSWPGFAATVPALGALLVLTGRGDGLLGLPPLQWLGRIAYPLYLWHWPLLLLPGSRLRLVLLGVGLAVLTHVLVERPLQRARRSFALGALLITAPLVAAGWTAAAAPPAPTRPGWGVSIAHVPL